METLTNKQEILKQAGYNPENFAKGEKANLKSFHFFDTLEMTKPWKQRVYSQLLGSEEGQGQQSSVAVKGQHRSLVW